MRDILVPETPFFVNSVSALGCSIRIRRSDIKNLSPVFHHLSSDFRYLSSGISHLSSVFRYLTYDFQIYPMPYALATLPVAFYPLLRQPAPDTDKPRKTPQ